MSRQNSFAIGSSSLTNPPFSTNSIASTTFSGESTSTLPSSTFEISAQQSSIQYVALQSSGKVIQTLIPAHESLEHPNGQCLDTKLIWFSLDSNLLKLLLQAYPFNLDNFYQFFGILEFLNHVNESKYCFEFGIRFNDQRVYLTLSDKPPTLRSNAPRLSNSLIFISSGSISRQPLMDDLFSLVFLPSSLDLHKPLSSESRENLKFFSSHQCPNLRHLLLRGMDLGNEIEDFVPIFQRRLNLVYIWNCLFATSNFFWSILLGSITLFNSIHPGKVRAFQFVFPNNGHITQIVHNANLLFVMPNSPDMVHGLICDPRERLPNNLDLDRVSILVFFPLKAAHETMFPFQSMRTLKPLMNHQCSESRCLLLVGMYFNDNTEDFTFISQSKLDLIYLWDCHFWVIDPIWSTLCVSRLLINSMHTRMVHGFQFIIIANDHTTQVVWNNNPSFLKPNSPDLCNGLILSLGQNFPSDALSNYISLLAFLPSKIGLIEVLSPQSRQNLKSMMTCRHPNLKYLLLKCIDFDANIEDFIAISRLRLDLIYLQNCNFRTSDLIWSALLNTTKLIISMRTGEIRGLRFAIPINGHITQIVNNRSSSFLMLDSPDLARGLIFPLEQNLSDDLLLANFSFIVFLPSEVDSRKLLSSQFKQNMKFIMNRQHPKLKHLLLFNINFNGNLEDSIPISQVKLDFIYLWNCNFGTSDPIWVALCDSAKLIDSMHKGTVQSFQFTIAVNGHITQVVINKSLSLVMPGSLDMVHGLILHLGQNFPVGLPLDDISFLVFIPSEVDIDKSPSSQLKQSLKSLGCSWPKLENLFLKGVSSKDVSELSCFDQQSELIVHVLQDSDSSEISSFR